MRPVLLVTSTTGYQAQNFRAAAEQRGIRLIIASDRCHQLEDPWRDGAVAVRFEDPVAAATTIANALPQAAAGIVALGDREALIAAHVAQILKVPFHSPRAAEIARNKFLFRERCQATGLRTPRFQRLPLDSDVAAAAEAATFPCVLKPLVLSASRGVIRADTPAEFTAALARIRALLKTPEVLKMQDPEAAWLLVEEFIPGAEIAVEALMTEGRLRVLAIFDKPDPLNGPFFEETIYVTPSRLSAEGQSEVEVTLSAATKAVGLRHGPLHAELRITADGPVMLECAARPIGGLCARTLRFEKQMSLEHLLLRHAAGENVEHLQRERWAAGVMMIPIPEAGIFLSVEGLEEAGRVEGIEAIEITAKPQQKLVPLPEGASYLGFIFARSENPAQVEAALRQAHAQLHFVLSPEFHVLRA